MVSHVYCYSLLSTSQVLEIKFKEEIKEGIKEENNVSLKIERKSVSLALGTDQELKLKSIIQDKNIYILFEEVLL